MFTGALRSEVGHASWADGEVSLHFVRQPRSRTRGRHWLCRRDAIEEGHVADAVSSSARCSGALYFSFSEGYEDGVKARKGSALVYREFCGGRYSMNYGAEGLEGIREGAAVFDVLRIAIEQLGIDLDHISEQDHVLNLPCAGVIGTSLKVRQHVSQILAPM